MLCVDAPNAAAADDADDADCQHLYVDVSTLYLLSIYQPTIGINNHVSLASGGSTGIRYGGRIG